jgi:hypothetical protein
MKSNIFIKMKEPKKLLTKNNYEVIARVVVRNGNFRKISFVKVSKIRTLSKKKFETNLSEKLNSFLIEMKFLTK